MHSEERHTRDRTSARRKEHAGLHPLRIAILDLLSGTGRPELPATALCHELPGTPSLALVTYHLEVLLDVGLVQANRSAPFAPVYSLAALAAPADSGQ